MEITSIAHTPENNNKRPDILSSFVDKENSSATVRKRNLLDRVDNAVTKRPNKKMQTEGVDYSSAPLGKLAFSDIKPASAYRDDIVEELRLRSVEPESTTDWNSLRRQLQLAEGYDDTVKPKPKFYFVPRTQRLQDLLCGTLVDSNNVEQ